MDNQVSVPYPQEALGEPLVTECNRALEKEEGD